MISGTLSYSDLKITPSDLYVQMGYGDSIPDEMTLREAESVLNEIKFWLNAQYCFFISDGELDEGSSVIISMGREHRIGRVIARQLRGAKRYAYFVATAGDEFEEYQHRLMATGDMVKVFIADSIGSVIAEKAADRMEEALEALLLPSGWKHTNRFSPGYCGWGVSGQQQLFPMFPDGKPCGVTLSSSSLMTPIKSVSGVIGLGPDVRKLDYSCGLCGLSQCYKRRRT